MSFFNKTKTLFIKLQNFSQWKHASKSTQVAPTLISLSLILAGCSTASETFDCEAGKGVGCQSITKVNKMIDQGHFFESKEGFTSPLSAGASLKATPPSLSPSPFSNSPSATVVLSDHTVVQRIAEQPIRVWVAPYQDESGNFHEASVVHSVIQGGYWHVQESDSRA